MWYNKSCHLNKKGECEENYTYFAIFWKERLVFLMALCMVLWVILKCICTWILPVLVENSQNSPLKSFLSWPQDQKYYCKANAASPHVNDHNIQRNKPENKQVEFACEWFVLVTTLPMVSHHSPERSLWLTRASRVTMRFERCSDAAAKPEVIGLWSVEVIERLENTQFAAHKMPTYTCSPEQTDMLFQLNKHMRFSCMETVDQLRPLNTPFNRINVQY